MSGRLVEIIFRRQLGPESQMPSPDFENVTMELPQAPRPGEQVYVIGAWRTVVNVFWLGELKRPGDPDCIVGML